ncbi:glycosyltransferase [Trypanosoma rangeli]|uniref:Glycosyltransferase n=1 Tax=Trypanosoma rangeli TaxID=5698 RepID=A0A422NDB1_TRYRA|nr:glycosyltransferase [Trypanosoma rangeli]RNF03477.1 glycosyltransferase [Trypanosoma rangeli]|eukprot:RNF03477.1 glycosyltransferase [Trypanosoma rangeli]
MHVKSTYMRQPLERQHMSLMRLLGTCARRPPSQRWFTLILLLLLLLLLLFSFLLIPTPFHVPGGDDYYATAAAATTLRGITVYFDVNASDGGVQPTAHTRYSRTFILPYGGTEEGGEEVGGSGDAGNDIDMKVQDDMGMRLQAAGYRLYGNVCLVRNGTRLRLHRRLEEKMLQRDVAFIVHGDQCDTGGLSREMTSLFAWLQQWKLLLEGRNESRLPLCTMGKEGDRVSCTITILIAVASDGSGRCMRKDKLNFYHFHLLHWIRVVTGRFHLSPWWSNDGSAADNMANARYVVVKLSAGRTQTSASLKLSSSRTLGCYSYAARTEKGSLRWFPSTSLAHRFRQRWLQYLHHQYSQKEPLRSDPVQAFAAMWGTQPLSPVLRRMILGAVVNTTAPTTCSSGKEVHSVRNESEAASMPSARRHSKRLAGAIKPRTLTEVASLRDAGPLRLTVLLPHATEQYDVKKLVLYLHEKFGRVSRIQLLYIFGEGPACADVEQVVVSCVHDDYLEVLRVLASTDLLITPHGAALASMVAMQPGSVVIELFPRYCRSFLYLELAVAMHVVYVSHEGKDQGAAKAHTLPGTGDAEGSMPWDAGGNASTSAAVGGMPQRPLQHPHPGAACRDRRTTDISAVRLYHLVKNGLSSVWLRNGRFSGVMVFDRR